MKVVTIRQPYVAAIFAGVKLWETRSRPTYYRGELGIHAGARPDWNALQEMGAMESGPDGWEERAAARLGLHPVTCGLGVIVGKVQIVNCIPTEEVPARQRKWGDFGPGRWAWEISRPEIFKTPIPAKGALSFWTFSDR